MSTAYGAAAGGSGPSQEWASNDWRGGAWRSHRCGFARWTPIELLAMILGFIVFWPIGLAILGFKVWQRKSGYPGDLGTAAQEKWREARSAFSAGPWGGRAPWRATGNMAFDEWRAAEIQRLEEERRKLDEAQKEFAAFVENIRRAKDREEFERFMNERRKGPEQPGPSA
ncbi:MAG TPA: DUF2852 domain-containing protein [Roseiarcus sp.]|nr:DUF2852 domain-containing protein [Roseiarcus sp.]